MAGAVLAPTFAFAADRTIRVLIAGQSLGLQWAQDTAQTTAFVARLRRAGETRPVEFINVCVGGSSSQKRYRYGAGSWWLEDDLVTAGPCLKAALAIVAASPAPTVGLWVQGEQDSWVYNGTTVAEDRVFIANYAQAVMQITQRLATGVPWFIQRLGPRKINGVNNMTCKRGMELVRTAQAAVVGHSGYYWGARPDSLATLADYVHPDQAQRIRMAQETADAIRGRI